MCHRLRPGAWSRGNCAMFAQNIVDQTLPNRTGGDRPIESGQLFLVECNMHCNRRIFSGLFTACVLALAGCSGHDKDSLTGVSNDRADQINAERNQSKFEQAKDPPLTAETHFAAGQLADVQGSYE